MNRGRFGVLTLSLFAAGCTCGALDPNARFACSTDDDCGPGYLCAPTNEGLECVLASDGGARDAGVVDGGVDRDHDGVPLPADCNDDDPSVFPGAMESCFNGLDDDCDLAIDCQDSSCDGRTCVGAGICTALVCRAATEVLCNDGLDNDGDGLVDCADPECPAGSACDDSNVCTTGDRCSGDGGCEQLAPLSCVTPPGTCFTAAGLCRADAGCVYTPRTGGCDDGRACTASDTCTSTGTCTGAPRSCPAPTNVCLSAGVCQEPTGSCLYPPRAAGSCDDGQSCTVNDSCDGDGGCRGAPVVCTPPSQCHVATGSCTQDGGCLFTSRVGACDAGAGAGTCNTSFTCVPTATARFPYVPSNFTEAQLPGVDAGVDFAVTCGAIINSSGIPAIAPSGGCSLALPPYVILTPFGGEQTLLFLVRNLTVSTGVALVVAGTRPVIFAVLGDATIDGTVITVAGGGTSSLCGTGGLGASGPSTTGKGGGGGGGYGSLGGPGGPAGTSGGAGAGGIINGTPVLIPLRGGCNGAAGSPDVTGGGAVAGPAGGALQISVAGALIIRGTLSARGGGGGGGGGSSTGFNGSGGGGGSGGALLLEGATVTIAGRLTANGGGGGEAGGLINPGSDGTAGSDTTNLPAPGGNGTSNNSGNGGAGAAGLIGAGAGTAGNTSDQSGGGGGGGVGRIRINASMSCSYAGGALFSPPATSSGPCP